MELNEVRECRKRCAEKLHSLANVVSVGVGYKITGGVNTGRLCISVGVATKLAVQDLPESALVPKQIDGVETDVVAVGLVKTRIIRPEDLSARELTARMRPCPGGPSVGHRDITAGTLGLWVGRYPEPDALYLLSNNHVLANENKADLGDPIYQPGPYDGGDAGDTIAVLDSFTPIDFIGGENYVDCALAKVLDPKNVLGEILTLGRPADLFGEPVPLDLPVQKVGRTTELKKGRVSQIDVDVRVGYSDGSALFSGQIYISPGGFSAPGDSGSSVWTDDMRLLGLLFAGSETITVINPQGYVFGALHAFLR